MAIENKGIIYYKLDNEFHYDGDYTKNSGLTGGEIDGNFHFLRGYDISSFELSENKDKLTIRRINGEIIDIDVKSLFSDIAFDYDNINGVLKVTLPYGNTFDLEGFLTSKSLLVHSDSTLIGDGTKVSPLGLSSSAKTGAYRPVKAIIDLEKESLPTKNITLNERYVTKEKVSKFGLLYPIEGVKALQKFLEETGSEWRVPTKADWDQLLNSVEDSEEYRTHDSELTNQYLGFKAGSYLKSNNFWEPIYRELEDGEVVVDGERFSKDSDGNYIPNENGKYIEIVLSDDKYGFSIYPVGFADRKGSEFIGGFGKWAAYWTATEDTKNDDMFVKIFSHKEIGVEQNSLGRGCYLSLRLVKNYNGNNFREVETIDGVSVTTKLFPLREGTKYNNCLIWTNENITLSLPQYGGVQSSEWPNLENTSYTTRYYINDWDGNRWVKNEILEGESVVVSEHEGDRMREWRLVDSVFIDTLNFSKQEFGEVLSEINKSIGEINETNNEQLKSIEELLKADAELISQIQAAEERLNTLYKNRDEIYKQLNERVAESDSSLEIVNGYTDDKGVTHKTHFKIKLPETGMLKLDAQGLYFDGNFNFNEDYIINNK